MSIIQFHIPKNLEQRAVARNLASTADIWAIGAAVQAAKKLGYSHALQPLNPDPVTNDEKLSMGHKGQFGLDARNAIYFLVEGSDLLVTLIDVKINVTRKNTIVSTPLPGQKGTVKEYIKGMDYQVKINGNLINYKPNAYPIEELREFIRLVETEGQVKVSSVFLDAFGIDTLVLENYTVNQSEGKYSNVQPFVLNFLSDEDVNLITIED